MQENSGSDSPGVELSLQELDSRKIHFDGEGFDLFLIMLKNIILTLLTLGVYSFWAKTEMRKFTLRHFQFQGHRLDYTGTGIELFFGFLKVLGFYIAFIVTTGVLSLISPFLSGAVGLVFGVLFPFLWLPLIIYFASRYRLSRTTYRGINFGMNGDIKGFISEFAINTFLMAITLGIYIPWGQNNISAAFINRVKYGNKSFLYTGNGSDVFTEYLLALFLIPLTLGLYFPWFIVRLRKYRAQHTYFEGVNLNFTATGFQLLKLILLAIAIPIFTLGLGTPWLIVYALKFWAKSFQFNGDINMDDVVAEASKGDGFADQMGDFLNLDIDIGI